MTDAEIVALERVLKLAEESALGETWPRPMEQALGLHAIETVRTFLETRGYGVPTFEPGEVAYLPDAKELDSFRADRQAEAYAYFNDLDANLGLQLDQEDIEAMAVELADKTTRRSVPRMVGDTESDFNIRHWLANQ